MFQIYPGFPGAFAADVSPDVASFMADSHVPWGVEALSGAITQPAWRTKPSWYLVTTEDKMIPPGAQKEKSGHIFQVSSVLGLRITGIAARVAKTTPMGGRIAYGGNTAYHAAKWAVGGFSDALAMEVAPFGVKVCTPEPGGIRTNWARRAGRNAPVLLPDYAASVGSMLELREVTKDVRKAIRGRSRT
jgi:NAD(P)-dependent dehydrogenase (short-subunit alcohol dehydrogenase family)